MDRIRVAVPKGDTNTLSLFRNVGYPLDHTFYESRKYIIAVEETNLEFILAKAMDIPTFVEYGAADIGIVGKEILLEEYRNIYELLDLKISSGYLCVTRKTKERISYPRIATSYPNIASNYFRNRNEQAKIIKVNGEMNVALETGLADHIIDVIVQNNNNGLNQHKERIHYVSARLIVNRASYTVKNEAIKQIMNGLSKAVAKEETVTDTSAVICVD